MRRAALILTSVLVLFMTAQGEAAGITNGTADNGHHPYVGVAYFDVGGKLFPRCSASLLSPTVVLTAGHCTVGTNAARVYFDEIVTGNRREAYTGKPYTYPGFCQGNCGPGCLDFPGDVGVIVLTQALFHHRPWANMRPCLPLDSWTSCRTRRPSTL